MSIVSLLDVNVINSSGKFTDKYEFEITFECLEQLEKGEVLIRHVFWGYFSCLFCLFFRDLPC